MKFTKNEIIDAIKNYNSFEIDTSNVNNDNTAIIKWQKRAYIIQFGEESEPDYDTTDYDHENNIFKTATFDFSITTILQPEKLLKNDNSSLLTKYKIANTVNLESGLPAIVTYREGINIYQITLPHKHYGVHTTSATIYEPEKYITSAIMEIILVLMVSTTKLDKEIMKHQSEIHKDEA